MRLGRVVAPLLVLALATADRTASSSVSWIPSAPLEGGYVSSIATGGAGTVFAGTWWKGVYRSTDGGTSWQQVSVGIPNITCVVVAPNGHVFASTASVYAGGGPVFRSTDGGDTWVSSGTGLPQKSVTWMAVNGNGTLFASTEGGGVYRSRDDGASWQLVLSSGGNVVYKVLVDANGRLYSCSDSGLKRSLNEGATWSTIIPSFYSYSAVTGTAVDVGTNTIYFSTLTDGTYRTSDDGATILKIYQHSGPLYVLPDHTVLLGAPFGMLRSIDEGDTWSGVGGGVSEVTSIVTVPGPKLLTGTEKSGVFASTDLGISWSRSSGGIDALGVVGIGGAEPGHVFVAGEDGALYVSHDLGQTWTRQPFGGCAPTSFVVTPTGVVAASGCDVLRSTDGGDTWLPSHTGLPMPSGFNLTRLASGRILLVEGDQIYLSDDDGVTWSPSQMGLSGLWVRALAAQPGGAVYAMAYLQGTRQYYYYLLVSNDQGASWSIVPSPAALWVLAADPAGRLFGAGGSNIVRSTDGGASWQNTGGPNANVITVDPSGRIYAGGNGSDGSVFVSEDHGDTWSAMSAGIASQSVFYLFLHPSGYLFAGTPTGPYRSDVSTPAEVALVSVDVEPGHVALHWYVGDQSVVTARVHRRMGSEAWQVLGTATSDGQGNFSYDDLDVQPATNYAYCLGIQSGSEELLSGEASVTVPASYALALEGVQPNPARKDWVVSLSLPDDSPADLNVFDMAGRRVLHRQLNGLGPGRHQVAFTGSRLASGVYLVRLDHGSQRLATRAVVIQ